MSRRRGRERRGQPGDPCVLVIFGASGDLTKRKLVPALLNLAGGGLLPRELAVVGVSTSPLSSEAFRARLQQALDDVQPEPDAARLSWLLERVHYEPGDFRAEETYARLAATLARLEAEVGTRGNVLFYLATPHGFFGEIVRRLGGAGLVRERPGSWRRVIIEKPFGHDHDSARALNRELRATLEEGQIYRIDHYLGKETVQNLMVFRFGNGIFEPIWNRRYIDHVQITVAETGGVEQRGRYYEEAGALRDMLPNHLFQLLALTAMEPPSSFEADAVRDEKAKVLRAIPPFTPERVLTETVRGQYGEAAPGGQAVPGYRSEAHVDPESTVETFVAMKLCVDNWRWGGVPFYLRTGKRLPLQHTEVAIHFRRPPHLLFRGTEVGEVPPNVLVLHIQPDEGISLSFQAKVPGPVVRTGSVEMDFQYTEHFGSSPSTGYETLLYDCMCGDATLFQRADSVEDGWAVVTPVIDVWKALPPRSFPNYAAGSWGPQEAEQLLAADGRAWRRIAD